MPLVEFYGTSGCHLCDQAMAVLDSAGCSSMYIDIADEEEKFDLYALRIPVLRRIDNGMELGWPFDLATVLGFIS